MSISLPDTNELREVTLSNSGFMGKRWKAGWALAVPLVGN